MGQTAALWRGRGAGEGDVDEHSQARSHWRPRARAPARSLTRWRARRRSRGPAAWRRVRAVGAHHSGRPMAVAACAVCAAPYARGRARERRVAPRAGLLDGIFGGRGGGGADDRRKRERDEQLALQRQKLEERRAGTSLRGFQERRAKIAASMRAEREERATRASRPMAEFLKGREAPADRGRAGAAPGRRMYDGKEDAPTGFGNIIIPQIPIGIEKCA